MVFGLSQLGTAIWFASSLNTKMKNLVGEMARLSLTIEKIGAQDVRMAQLEGRQNLLDARITGVESRLKDTRDLIIFPRTTTVHE